MKNRLTLLSYFTCAMSALPGASYAHHPLAGAPMETFMHGVLSGIGHPVIGFDHLFFVLAAGFASALVGRPYSAPAAYIVAMLGGTILASTGAGLPLVEAMVALSLLCLGGLLVWDRRTGAGTTLGLFVGFGLFHGSAFGESIAAQEAAVGLQVMIGYLLGLAVVQYLICAACARLGQGWAAEGRARAMETRLAGAAVAGVGLFLVLETVEGAAFAILGFG